MTRDLVLIADRYVSSAVPHLFSKKKKRCLLTSCAQSIITLVFFITYVIFQPPSTVIVRKVGPRIHLAAITVLWGAVMIGMGFVTEWRQLAALRVILGIFEAGFFPSCVYLLSTWYTRCENQIVLLPF